MSSSEKNILVSLVLILGVVLGVLVYQKVYIPSQNQINVPGHSGDAHDGWSNPPYEPPPIEEEEEEPQASNPFSGKLGRAIDEARKVNKNVFAFLSSESCSWCDKMKQTTLTEPEVKQALNDYIFVELLYTDDPDFMRSLGIQGFPSYVVLDKDGKVLNKWQGYMKSDEFISALNQQEAKGLFDKILRR